MLDYPEFQTKEFLGDAIFSPDFLASCDGCPFVVNHPTDTEGNPVSVNSENFRDLLDGILYAPQADKEHGRVLGRLKVFNPDVANAIEKGDLRELSQGYNCAVEKQNGEYNGTQYDRVQSDVIMNHIALVEQGRAGDAVKVLYNNRKQVLPAHALKDDYEKFQRRRENMKKQTRSNVDEQTTTGKPNPQNTVNEDEETQNETPEEQGAEDNAMSALSKKVEDLAGVVAQLAEKVGLTANADNPAPEGDGAKKEDEKENGDVKEMQNKINSLPSMAAKAASDVFAAITLAASQAQLLIGEDAQDFAHRLNDVSAYRKLVLKRANAFTDKEVDAMGDTEAKIALGLLAKNAKLRVNAPQSVEHSGFTEAGDVRATSLSQF